MKTLSVLFLSSLVINGSFAQVNSINSNNSPLNFPSNINLQATQMLNSMAKIAQQSNNPALTSTLNSMPNKLPDNIFSNKQYLNLNPYWQGTLNRQNIKLQGNFNGNIQQIGLNQQGGNLDLNQQFNIQSLNQQQEPVPIGFNQNQNNILIGSVMNSQNQQINSIPLINSQSPLIKPDFVLNINSKSNYQKIYNLKAGFYIIKLNLQNIWRQNGQVQIIIQWNGQTIAQLKQSSQRFQKLAYEVYANQGNNKLSFSVTGFNSCSQNYINIYDLICQQKPCTGNVNNNLIINGGFEDNRCNSQWCAYNKNNFSPLDVPGWIPDPEIQVGKGYLYGFAIKSWVSQLDPHANTCISQKVKLRPGKHSLQFEYAGRVGISQESNRFNVLLNGRLLKEYSPSNSNIVCQRIAFNLPLDCPIQSMITFCGTGKSDSLGTVIDNVKLFYLDGCSNKF